MDLLGSNLPKKTQTGFTLIELVAVIVLLGIIGVGVTSYIRTSIEAYREVTQRTDIAQIGRFAVERISREVKAALPGSVRTRVNSTTNDECLEFVPVLGSSIYVDLPVTSTGTSFDVVDFPQAGNTNISRVAVYTINNADVYSQTAGNAFVASINSIPSVITNGLRTITLASTNQFPQASSVKRIYFVDQPVSFCINSIGQLTRYENYGYNATQPVTPTGANMRSSLVAEQLSGTPAFSFSQTVQRPGGSVSLDFTFTAQGATDETVQFIHDIALVNVQ